MKKILFPLLSFILLGAAFAQAQNTVSHSAISFKFKNLGVYATGTIGGLQATVHFNPANMAQATIDASVDVATINTDNSLRDDHLKSDEFLDVARYAKILIKSVAIVHKSGDKYTGQFNLTIKNKTKLVQIPFTYSTKGDLQTFNGSLKINRLDYGIGGSSLTLSDEITISIEAELRD